MERNISKKIFELLKSKGILAISGGLLTISCSTQIGAYTETDGVYYDPNKDTFPEIVEGYAQTNQIDEHYSYGEESAYEKSRKHGRYGSSRYTYRQDEELGSDWGNYIGTETYYNNWGGYYSPYSWGNFGWGLGFGYGWNSYFQLSYGWNSPWYGYGWGSYYTPYWNRFNNFYNSYHIGGYYDPFYYGSYYRTMPRYNYHRSGTDNIPITRNIMPSTSNNKSGFRNGNVRYSNTQSNERYSNHNQRYNSKGGFRNAPQVQMNRSYQTQPSRSYNTERHNNNSGWRNNNSNSGGFRSSGFSSGSSNGGFGNGTTRSGSSGGFRSGGFR